MAGREGRRIGDLDQLSMESYTFEGVEVRRLVVGPLDVNCYIIWDTSTLETAVIDPGGDIGIIEDVLTKEGLKVKYVLNTHGHFDHVGANGDMAETYGVSVAIHKLDAVLLDYAEHQAEQYGVRVKAQPEPGLLLEDNTIIKLGETVMKVIHTPGHSEGGVCFFVEALGLLFTGDTIFRHSVGRTDLGGGSHEELMTSIKEKILPLGDSVKLFPGHGPESSIADEKQSNPYVRGVL